VEIEIVLEFISEFKWREADFIPLSRFIKKLIQCKLAIHISNELLCIMKRSKGKDSTFNPKGPRPFFCQNPLKTAASIVFILENLK